MRWLDSITSSMDMNLNKTLGDSKGRGSLVCLSTWGLKESDMTWWLSNENYNKELIQMFPKICYLKYSTSETLVIFTCIGKKKKKVSMFN